MSTATMSRTRPMSSLRLALELSGSNRALMPILAVFSFAASAWVALVVAGGTYMFYMRSRQPEEALDPRMQLPGVDIAGQYPLFAMFACIVLVPVIIGVSAKAAVAGADGRETRLATLRLLGLSSGAVYRIALWETMAEAIVGTALGTAIYYLTLPAWSALEFQYRAIEPGEMMLPLPLLALVWAILLAITGLAVAWGLLRVSISPLGVARRQTPPRLRAWRVALFVVVFIVAMIALRQIGTDTSTMSTILAWALIGIVLLTLNLAMGFILQVVARLISMIPLLPVSAHTALARIYSNPVRAWSRVSPIAFVCFILGMVTALPKPTDLTDNESIIDHMLGDIWTGAFLTVALAFLLLAVSTVLTQSARAFEEADLAQALGKIGAPRAFLTRIAMLEVLLPLILATLVGFGLGRLVFSQAGVPQGETVNPAFTIGVIGGGFALVVIAVAVTEAIRAAARPRPARRVV